ncbi:MAG: hypothetical protein HKN85_01460 [Gammaproteobacteria bacterium]|nr:hypothetical protein [Gammaproteobacteria bacterium]
MNTLKALIKREILEHRNIWRVPVILIGMAVLVRLSLSIGNFALDVNIPSELQLDETIHSGVVTVLSKSLNAMNFIIMLSMFVVAIFYALSCLFNERQDDSVLFWRSLPISDSLTVASKLATAVVVIPLIIVACQAVVGVVFLGTDSMQYLFDFYGQSLLILAKMVVWALLPIIAWCLFCSEVAQKNPFLLAFIAPILFILVDKLFLNGAISQTLVIDRLASFSNFKAGSLFWGTLLSAVFLTLAVVKRSQRI